MSDSKHHDFSPPARTEQFFGQNPAELVSEGPPETPLVAIKPVLPALPGVRDRAEASTVPRDRAVSSTQLALPENIRKDFKDHFDSAEMLGSGNFGSVHKCRDQSSGKIVAVKVLNDKHDLGLSCATGPDAQRYRSALMMMDCPHILKYHRVFDGSSACFIVMEFLEGADFFEFMMSLKRFTESDAADWIRQILTGIAWIHDRGVTHRDIKPENVVWSQKGNTGVLKLVDFGLATLDLPCRALRRQDPVGTLMYCAPEVLAGSANMTCDVWGVGIMVYTLLSGDIPYDVAGKHGEEQVVHPAKEQGLPMSGSVWESVSSTAKSYVRSLLHLDPLRRPSSGEALDQLWDAPPLAEVEVTDIRQTSISKSMVCSKKSIQYVSNKDQHRAIEERRVAEERQAAAQRMWAWQNQCF